MFTGIVEEIGIIKEFTKRDKNALIVVECKKILGGSPHPNPPPQGGRGLNIKIGDSIAINGICQTVTSFNQNSFSAQISQETLSVTTFSKLKAGDKVNLERALTLSSRLGGHIVTGHIDGVAKVKHVEKQKEFCNLKLEFEQELTKYIAKKGSITINGVSLTIADIVSNEFSVAVIPHTFENTTLKDLKIGDFVNIEVDILAKYVEKILSTNNNKTIDTNFLKENGFF